MVMEPPSSFWQAALRLAGPAGTQALPLFGHGRRIHVGQTRINAPKRAISTTFVA